MSVFKTTFSRALRVIPTDNANVPFPAVVASGENTEVVPQNQTVLTSGTLVIGVTYEITNYESGDDFLNVGATDNQTGDIFVAIGTTPTDWTNGSELTDISSLFGDYLVDSNATFVTSGVKTGDIIYNTTDGTACTVVNVVNETTLSLNAYIFSATSKDYVIYQASPQSGLGNQGCFLYVGGAGNVRVTTIGQDIITFTAVPVGTVLPVQVIKVHSLESGTTATLINALW